MPIPATATRSAGMPGTDTAVSGSAHRTPNPQSSGCKIHAPSAALCSGIEDNWKDAHDRGFRFAPCTVGLNHCPGVASASDLHGNFPKLVWWRAPIQADNLEYGALHTPILSLLRYPMNRKWKSPRWDIYRIRYAAGVLTLPLANSSRSSKHSPTLSLRKRLLFGGEERGTLQDRLQDENLILREKIDDAFMFDDIVGSSPVLQSVLSSIVRVAPTDTTILISGETGSGKELIARAIHKRSRRSNQAFVSINCAAIPPSLIASELFGHEKGAFTGAVQQRRGRFELAHSGTIFLDEIGEVPVETQLALLRVLQERQFERVGGSRAIPVDVRIIAATNRDLSLAIAAGTFRSDLFYRLNVFPIQVPPLRKRTEDIPLFIEYFVKKFAEKMAKRIKQIEKRTLELCQAYSWPGNIRELQNIVERSMILCTGDTFSIDEAWLSIEQPSRTDMSGPLIQTLQDQEKEMIEAAL